MSLDPTWMIVAPLLLGQLALFVGFTNILHASGLPDRALDVLNLVVLGTLLVLSVLIAGGVIASPWSTWSWTFRAYVLACLATALIGLPLASFCRISRRVPAGTSSVCSRIDLAAVEDQASLIGTGKYSWMLRLPGNESFRLNKVECELILPGLPAEWDGLSLLQLSDLHFAPCFRRRFFEAVADEAAAWDSDIVAFTGDMLDHDSGLDWIVPVMSRLRGRLGTFAILGNHDLTHHPRSILQALEHAGYTDLEGRWERLEIEGATLAIGGTSDPWGPRLDFQGAPEADFRLLLSHSPDQFPRAARAGIDLVLAGHNHAGQIRLPLVGPVFMPSRYSRRFDRGFFRTGRTTLHVSPGIAGKHPIRYGNCGPELTRIVLRVGRPTTSSSQTARSVSVKETALNSVLGA